MTEIRHDQIVMQDVADDPLVAASKDVALSDMIGEGFQLSSGKFDNKTYDLSALIVSVSGVYVSPDGVYLYIVGGNASDFVQRFTLSTPWDVSSSTPSGTFSPVESGTESGIWLKPDGTMLFILLTSGVINSYSISVPWDLNSTVTFIATGTAGSGNRNGMYIKDDGLIGFVISNNPDEVEQFDMATPWDLTTLTNSGITFSVGAQEFSPTGVGFSKTGNRMFMVGGGTGINAHQYDLSTPWDITSAVYNSVSLSYDNEFPFGAADLFLRSDTGASMILVGGSTKAAQYDIAGQVLIKRASETVEGVLSLATQAEVDAGSDTLKAVTPSTLSSNTVFLPLDGSRVMTGNLKLENAAPRFEMKELSAPFDEGTWDTLTDAGVYRLRSINDAGTVSSTWMSATRTGNNVTSINFFAPVSSDTAPTAANHLTRKDYVDTRAPLGNYAGTVAPIATDDNTAGYSVGSVWVDVVALIGYMCMDATTSTAVWKQITN